MNRFSLRTFFTVRPRKRNARQLKGLSAFSGMVASFCPSMISILTPSLPTGERRRNAIDSHSRRATLPYQNQRCHQKAVEANHPLVRAGDSAFGVSYSSHLATVSDLRVRQHVAKRRFGNQKCSPPSSSCQSFSETFVGQCHDSPQRRSHLRRPTCSVNLIANGWHGDRECPLPKFGKISSSRDLHPGKDYERLADRRLTGRRQIRTP